MMPFITGAKTTTLRIERVKMKELTNQTEPYKTFAILLAFVFAIIASAAYIDKSIANKKAAALKAEGCSIVSKEETGKQIYCGKACWRKEIRVERYCSVSNTTKVWFE